VPVLGKHGRNSVKNSSILYHDYCTFPRPQVHNPNPLHILHISGNQAEYLSMYISEIVWLHHTAVISVGILTYDRRYSVSQSVLM
jgi:hypothetical protein